MERDISTNIKKVFVVFLLCFVVIMSYIAYFILYKADAVAKSPYNRRLLVIRNEVLRGTIYDRNMTALTKSERVNAETQKRVYTAGEVFAHALGYIDEKYGLTGLERKYDAELMGLGGIDLSSLIKSKDKKEERVGKSIKTTLDSDVQKLAYELLGIERGAVVALNPKTGEILAMVSKPSFDPNNLSRNWEKLQKSESQFPLLNRATAGLYPPGSVFKIITAVSGLENIQGLKDRKFKDEGKLVFNANESLSNYNGTAYGNISLDKAIYKSSNVYFGSLGIELGNDKLKATAEKFFFNKDIPANGITIENSRFPTYKSNEKGNIAQSAIGQAGVLVTPMEMVLTAGTIANDGVMMKPSIVSQILDDKGKVVKDIKPESIGNIISKENAAIIKEAMREVVTSGTGKAAAISGISVAGKTGTADHDDIPGIDEVPHSWFIGFAPYENPQVAVAVIVEEGGTGGKAAATIAGKIMKEALKK
ncbi:penicillin-binding transpeptidase domain-containing protein [Clostridium sp. SYSU_GA19001]|uniref:peptidoglycan D,D-transpeptidase FtsI family protein n=1 Tax=Clostridium caldaquaticum TaxID=2940653 RepID=UPI002076E561|nr:penicillin-binding transpeptidase domain-containing protein [Clostridium caldaquaticum]MCM8710163.1 penicillin-binding transpeptidase domain-containing protein [Clostridium caldaquaticum]